MAAPTPVSAYLHAAAMVKAGVYLVARLTPGFADSPPWRPMVDHARPGDHAAGGLAGGARVRPQADPGVRHGQPARPHHGDGRCGRQRHDAGRAGDAVRARHVQGRAVHGRRHHRPRHRHPRHPQAGLARRPQQAAADHRGRRDGEHGRAAAVPRLRRQGSRPTKPCCTARRWAHAAPFVLAGDGVRARSSPPSTACGSCGARSPEGQGRAQQARRRDAPPARDIPRRRRRSWPRRACSFGVWPPALDNVLDDYADTVPGDGDYDLALWHGFNLPLLLSALVLGVGTAAFFARTRLRRDTGWSTCRSATPTASTTRRSAAPTCFAVRLTGTSPSAVRSRPPSR